jgi:flagellar assembly protein FliH
MPSSSRIVFAEDLVGATPWMPGVLHGERRVGAERRVGSDRREAEAPAAPPPPGYEDGLRDGYERGRQEARLESQAERRAAIEDLARRGDALLESMTAQFAALQQAVAEDLTALAVEIARSAFGAALRLREDAVAPAIAEAMAVIVDEHARPRIHLHPEDQALLGESLAPLLAARGAQLVADAGVLRGGCRVETTRASVDATVQTRWKRAVAAIGRDDEWVDA